MIRTVIFGCGGHARSVASVLLSSNSGVEIFFIDAHARKNERIFNFDVIQDVELRSDDQIFIAIGSNEERSKIYEKMKKNHLISIIASSAILGIETSLGKNNFIGNFCHVGPLVALGDNNIINNAAVVEHEVSIGSHCHVGPNATISGRSTIGDFVFLGVGSTVIDKIEICSNVIVGAGATVVKSIREPGTYVGSPAKKIK